MSDVLQLLDRQEQAMRSLYETNQRLLQLARTQAKELAARTADDDEWTRLPSKKDRERCRFSKWSLSTLNRRIESGEVRRKRIAGTTFYSGSDVRRLIQGEP